MLEMRNVRLHGKIAIVTGSSSGIGKAIALRFGQEGATVVVAARRKTLSEQTVHQIQQNGGEALAIQTDVADERQVERLMGDTVTRYGRIDILVNNAGIGGGGLLAETSTHTFDQVMGVNLRGTFFCCREAFRHMKQQGGGVIINMSSVAGCTAHDFLDTVIAIFAPTCGSQRSAIGAPRPSVCVVF
ncbi:MAG: hypothetical protein CV089_08315 [Nitrospira sp. WS110]|nr:hypothetical protein [Nitrospira sp. WS110]